MSAAASRCLPHVAAAAYATSLLGLFACLPGPLDEAGRRCEPDGAHACSDTWVCCNGVCTLPTLCAAQDAGGDAGEPLADAGAADGGTDAGSVDGGDSDGGPDAPSPNLLPNG